MSLLFRHRNRPVAGRGAVVETQTVTQKVAGSIRCRRKFRASNIPALNSCLNSVSNNSTMTQWFDIT